MRKRCHRPLSCRPVCTVRLWFLVLVALVLCVAGSNTGGTVASAVGRSPVPPSCSSSPAHPTSGNNTLAFSWRLEELFGEVYVITADPQGGAMQRFRREADLIGLCAYRLWPAITPAQLNSERGHNLVRRLRGSRALHRLPKLREVSAYLTRYDLLKYLMIRYSRSQSAQERTGPLRSVLVLSDRVAFGWARRACLRGTIRELRERRQAGRLLQEAMCALPDDWDLLYLSSYYPRLSRTRQLDCALLLPLVGSLSADAFVVRGRALSTLVSRLSRVEDSEDRFFPLDIELARSTGSTGILAPTHHPITASDAYARSVSQFPAPILHAFKPLRDVAFTEQHPHRMPGSPCAQRAQLAGSTENGGGDGEWEQGEDVLREGSLAFQWTERTRRGRTGSTHRRFVEPAYGADLFAPVTDFQRLYDEQQQQQQQQHSPGSPLQQQRSLHEKRGGERAREQTHELGHERGDATGSGVEAAFAFDPWELFAYHCAADGSRNHTAIAAGPQSNARSRVHWHQHSCSCSSAVGD
jgi:hypothetical protein